VTWLACVGWGAAGLLVALWLAVSLMAPGRRRETVEWLAASSLYVTLLALFTNHVRDARADDSEIRLVAFGFLWIVFAGGLAVTLANGLRSLRGPTKTEVDATH
jgi:transposase